MKELFNELRAVNVNGHTETVKQGNVELTYLSWAWAVDEISKAHDFEYEVKFFDGRPYLHGSTLGYMVFTSCTVDGVKKDMWLPVMDSHNKAMRSEPYEVKTKYNSYTVQACTMFDINKAIMRCLTKNLAMFGLGLYIYAGEDLPESDKKDAKDAGTQIMELYKKYHNSDTLKGFIRASLKKSGVSKVSEIPVDEQETLLTMILSSMNTIEEENKGC